MTVLAVVYIVSLLLLVGALLMSPEHTYRGRLAALNVLVLFVSGLAMAFHSL